MNAIQTLKNEHQNILRMLKIIRTLCIHTFETKEVYYDDFYKVIDFIRNYADKFHHGKEEDILFKAMGDELGDVIKQGPIYGMLTEHDLGRLFVKNLEEALIDVEKGNTSSKVDIIANAIAYTDLLYRHIDKENNAIFSFAEKSLSVKTHEELNEAFKKVKDRLDGDQVEKKYISLLDMMEKRLMEK